MSNRTYPYERPASAAFAALLMLALFPISDINGGASLAVITLIALLGWRLIPSFWQRVLGGAVAGGVAGLVVLGPGLRIAMRVVAILDDTRANEFTIGGTALIVIFVGGILGATIGVSALFTGQGLNLGRAATSVVAASIVMAIILADSELSRELRDLGAGIWMNFPMFGGIALLYGWTMQNLYDRLGFIKKRTAQQTEVMA